MDQGELDIDSGDFSRMRKLGIYVDVNIICKEKHFGAHKLILSMYSDYFRSTFVKLDALSPHVSRGKTSILIDDVQPEDIENILTYMYEGEVRVEKDNVDGFLKACKYFQLDELQTLITQTDRLLEQELMSNDRVNTSNQEQDQDQEQDQKESQGKYQGVERYVRSSTSVVPPPPHRKSTSTSTPGPGTSLTLRRKKQTPKAPTTPKMNAQLMDGYDKECLSSIRPDKGQGHSTSMHTIETVNVDMDASSDSSSSSLNLSCSCVNNGIPRDSPDSNMEYSESDTDADHDHQQDTSLPTLKKHGRETLPPLGAAHFT